MNKQAQRIRDIPLSSTVSIADQASALIAAGHRVIDFSAGRASESTPEYVAKAASKALLSGDTHQTMARGTEQYRQACASKLARENGLHLDPRTEIMATSGVKQALTLALLAVINPGDEVLVEDPCFVSYLPLIQIAGGIAKPLPLLAQNRFRWTKEQLESSISGKTKAILLNSPNNPTGTVHTKEDLEIVARAAIGRDLMVISDEIYERVAWQGREHICIATLPGMQERTITCMGLSKTFAMGGWRIGFACAPPDILDGMVKLQQHLLTCANSFVQAGAAVAFAGEPAPEVREMWREWEARCRYMTDGLNQIPGLKCRMPEGGFYAWTDITQTGYGSEQMTDRLLSEARVTVVPGNAFGPSGEGYIRITCVKSPEDLKEGLMRIHRVLA